jgi:2-polyprenyl-3-methyl-5-hydroxy-6-metoxy-1,4-benzoquinol methylase
MKISLNRTEFVAKKLGNLNGDKILDLGCRNMILKKYLNGNFIYKGLDYISEKSTDIDFINHNLEKGLPNNLETVDSIVALDVLEHIENIHYVYSELFSKVTKLVIIALPNMGYYKFRFNFLFTGVLSGKYIFSDNKTLDRHRWIPNYHSINKFVLKNTPSDFNIESYDYIAERKRNFFFYHLEKFFSKFFPSLFVYEKIFFLRKKN